MDFDPIRHGDFDTSQPLEPDLKAAQDAMRAADHLVFVWPLWLGTMPALLKGFLERTFEPGFAIDDFSGRSGWPKKLLKGKSARIVMTMGMPGLVYRLWFGAHALKVLKRNILGFCGVGPIRTSIHGMVEAVGDAKRKRWLEEMEALGREAR
jgi:putative NADPH-quinone reductase